MNSCRARTIDPVGCNRRTMGSTPCLRPLRAKDLHARQHRKTRRGTSPPRRQTRPAQTLRCRDVARYAGQLTAILGYVAQLKAVDVTGAEPMAHPLHLKNVMREDVVTASLPVDVALANAPERDGPFFAVPKVLDNGMGGG